MDVGQEIARQVEKLPPDMQEQVLRFVASLSASAPVGEKGARLRQFSSSLDSVSAQQMSQAIEEECEQVDAGEWQVLAGYQPTNGSARPSSMVAAAMRSRSIRSNGWEFKGKRRQKTTSQGAEQKAYTESVSMVLAPTRLDRKSMPSR